MIHRGDVASSEIVYVGIAIRVLENDDPTL